MLLRKSNFAYRPECEVTRINVDGSGKRVTGFTFVDSSGEEWEQPADLVILSRYSLSTYAGSLQGTTLALQTVVRDDAVEKKAFQTNTGFFWGTLEGFEPGSFSFIVHNVVDRSNLPATPFEAKFVVVENTGSGGLEGICGGGILKTVGAGTEYDYTFRFGKDCKAND